MCFQVWPSVTYVNYGNLAQVFGHNIATVSRRCPLDWPKTGWPVSRVHPQLKVYWWVDRRVKSLEGQRCNCCDHVVGSGGFEPPTDGLLPKLYIVGSYSLFLCLTPLFYPLFGTFWTQVGPKFLDGESKTCLMNIGF